MEKIKIFEAFAGYGSQSIALDLLAKEIGLEYEVVGISEIDANAIKAYYAVRDPRLDANGEELENVIRGGYQPSEELVARYPNYGDISKVDWQNVPDFNLLTYSFPCFVMETLVLTDKGYKRIADVTTNDKVITHTNAYQQVYRTMERIYKGNLYTIKGMGMDELKATEEHPFYVRKRRFVGHKRTRIFTQAQWTYAKDLCVGDYLGYAINNESNLPQWNGVIVGRWGHTSNKLSALFNIPEFWYVMGRYVGDGWKRKSTTGAGIVICCSDRNKESLINAIGKLGWNFSVDNAPTVVKIHICSKELSAFVDRYGYLAHGKRIDAETIALPTNLLRYFLQGNIDSDGYTTKDGLIKLGTVSRELAYGLAQCAAKVYKRPFSIYKSKRKSMVEIEGRICNQRDSYNVVFKPQTNKQDRAFYEDGTIWYPIKEITSEYTEVPVFNLSVEEDETYTANGAIVHNCTDISNAGLQKGLSEGSGTRSSLLWECARAIETKMPKYLLMENVKALVSDKFMPDFKKWAFYLESLGYTNFYQVMNSKDYGVPQNRERVFMVSILSDTPPIYYFPKPFKLDRRLKHVLETNVDESYYLSDEKIQAIIDHCERKQAEGCGFKTNFQSENGCSGAITGNYGQRETDTYIKEDGKEEINAGEIPPPAQSV